MNRTELYSFLSFPCFYFLLVLLPLVQIQIDRLDDLLKIITRTALIPIQTAIFIHQFVITLQQRKSHSPTQHTRIHRLSTVHHQTFFLNISKFLVNNSILLSSQQNLFMQFGMLFNFNTVSNQYRLHHLRHHLANQIV